MNDKINKILARGVIIKYTFDKNNVEYDDIKIDDNNILLEGIKSLINNDKEFFLISRLSDLNFIETTYDIVYQYRKLPNKNTKLINEIIRDLNQLSVVEFMKEDIEEYIKNDILARGIIIDNLEDITYGMLYDAVIYCALSNNRFNIDNYEAIISSTNYFINKVPEIYQDNNIYQNTIIMIDTIINNSIPLTNRRKVAKYMRKNLETIRIHE